VTIESIELRGAIAEILVSGDASGGSFTLVRYTAPPRFVAGPRHRHAVTAEAFHVLDGTLTVELDDATLLIEEGESIAVAPGAVHAFRNDSDLPVTMLVIAAPPGLERFLTELSALIAATPTWPPQDRCALDELCARYDQLPQRTHPTRRASSTDTAPRGQPISLRQIRAGAVGNYESSM
jgi:quercetin dioxygenase-like cupin family protein